MITFLFSCTKKSRIQDGVVVRREPAVIDYRAIVELAEDTMVEIGIAQPPRGNNSERTSAFSERSSESINSTVRSHSVIKARKT